MSNMIFYVEQCLSEWVKWRVQMSTKGLGYPSSSIEAKMMSNNIVHRNYGSRCPYFISNPRAEKIDKYIIELSEQNEKLSTALCLYYLEIGTIYEKARSLKISPTQFKVHVDMARQWLAGVLTAMAK